jgi:hypothetical protein
MRCVDISDAGWGLRSRRSSPPHRLDVLPTALPAAALGSCSSKAGYFFVRVAEFGAA